MRQFKPVRSMLQLGFAITIFVSSCTYGTRNVTYNTTPAPANTTTVVNTPPSPPPPPPDNSGNVVTVPTRSTVPVVIEGKPHIQVAYPVNNPYVASDRHVQFGAHIDLVNYAADIQVTWNGSALSSWYFNPKDGTLNADLLLMDGNNVLSVVANNSFGSDAVSAFMQYTPPVNYQTNTGGYITTPQIVMVSPMDNRLTTANNLVAITATINNVNSINEILVKHNGVSLANFTFDPYSRTLQLQEQLFPGDNYFCLVATNEAGTDDKTLNVYFAPPVVVSGNTIQPPIISLANNLPNPYIIYKNQVTIGAIAANIFDKHQLEVVVNGQRTRDFFFSESTGEIRIDLVAAPGSNHIYIRANNDAGSDSRSLDVIYSLPSLPLPVINITAPLGNPFQSVNDQVLIDAFVDNICNADQMEVEVNGVRDVPFNYYPSIRKMELSARLNPGGNSIHIHAHNASGATHQTIQVIFTPPAIPAPEVTIVTPISNPLHSAVGTANVVAHVRHVNSQSDIQVKLNGNWLTNLNFDGGSHELRFSVPLNEGSNRVKISASNSGGTDYKELTIIYAPAPNKPVVLFTYPSSSPFEVTTSSITLTASVNNVTGPRDIELKLNGTIRTDFAFSSATHQLQFTAPLAPGNNFLNLSATNSSGYDSKSMEVTYHAPHVDPKPSVTLLNPAASPYTSMTNTTTVTAVVMNVNAAADIQAKVNGILAPNINYDLHSHQLVFNASLHPGNNLLSVEAATTAGSDGKSFDIIYNAPAPQRPAVSLTSPARTPFNTTTGNMSVEAHLLNIDNRNEVMVTVNGTPVTNFNFHPSTQVLDFYTDLRSGKNDLSVMATNAGGTDKKDFEVNYTPASGNGNAGNVPKPVVQLMNPSVSPFAVSAASITLNAFVENVAANDVHLTHDNSPVTGFSFNPGSHALNYTTSLHPGANTFVISGSNTSGADSKTVVVNFTPAAPAGNPPVITLTSPGQPGFTTTDPHFAVTALVTNMTGNTGISVNINSSPVPFTFDAGTKVLTISGHLQTGQNDIHIMATNTSGTDSKTTSVKLSTLPNLPGAGIPVVTFTNPNQSLVSTTDMNFVVSATVQQVASSSELTVTNNGRPVPFNFNTFNKQVLINGPLANGSNSFVIKAVTTKGIDLKTAVVNFTPAATGGKVGKPVIQLQTPVALSSTVATAAPAVIVVVSGINAGSDVSVKVNNAVFTSGIMYSPLTHTITFTPSLILLGL